MTIRQLPVAPAGRPCAGVTSEPQPSALERWNGGIRAASDNDNSISILMLLDVITGMRGSRQNASPAHYVQ